MIATLEARSVALCFPVIAPLSKIESSAPFMGKYRHNTNGSTELVLVKQNFLLRGIRDSRTLIVQVLIGAMHGLVVSILVIRNFALTEFALARLHCTYLSH